MSSTGPPRDDMAAAVGADVVLECAPPMGNPPPVVRWRKDGDNLDLTSSSWSKVSSRERVVLREEGAALGRDLRHLADDVGQSGAEELSSATSLLHSVMRVVVRKIQQNVLLDMRRYLY